MKALGISLIAALALAPFGCGGDDGNSDSADGNDVVVPDAKVVDAPPSIDANPFPADCDYSEQQDLANTGQDGGTPEQTDLGFDGTATKTLCGQLNSDHYTQPVAPSTFGLIDSDFYIFTASTDTKVIVTLTGDGFNADKITPLLQIVGGTGSTVDFRAEYDATTHRNVTSAILPAGTYGLFVAAAATVADKPTSPSLYRIKLTLDPTDGCPMDEALAPTYVEALDGANNVGNNVVKIGTTAASAYTLTPVVQGTPADAPEPTAITLTPMSKSKITGTAANSTQAAGDANIDTDTFEFTTDGTTNQVRLRIDWPSVDADDPLMNGVTPDLDGFLFEKPVGTAELADPVATFATGNAEEYVIATVKPSTTYWLTVGGYKATNQAPNFPVNYQVRACGERYTP